jgi:hypothetical protein
MTSFEQIKTAVLEESYVQLDQILANLEAKQGDIRNKVELAYRIKEEQDKVLLSLNRLQMEMTEEQRGLTYLSKLIKLKNKQEFNNISS